VSSAIVPRTIRSNESSYGPIGAVFAFESWLVIIMGVLVVGTTLGAIIGLSDSRFGRLIRGTADPDGWRREPKHVHFVRVKRSGLTDAAAATPPRPLPSGAGSGRDRSGHVGESQPADHAAGVGAPVDPRTSEEGRPAGDDAVNHPAVDGRQTPT
jgi:hypothetical protein